MWMPDKPYNDLPALPPEADVETPAILKACITASRHLAALHASADLIPNQHILTNTLPLMEAQASSEIENIVTTADELFRYAAVENTDTLSPAMKEAFGYRTAMRHGFDHAVCHKVRHGDHTVQLELPDVVVGAREVVLIDDVASTGQTVAQAACLLLAAGAASVDVAVTHALFAGDALAVLRSAGVGEIWSTDCIAHSSNAISMAAPIASALAEVLGNNTAS